MQNNTEQQKGVRETNEAATKALERERATPPGEIPVKQHNPGDQGLNPAQRGPGQPSGTDDAA